MGVNNKMWLTYDEAKNYIGCKKTKFFELIKYCNFKTMRVGQQHFVEKASIDSYLKSNIRRSDYYGQ